MKKCVSIIVLLITYLLGVQGSSFESCLAPKSTSHSNSNRTLSIVTVMEFLEKGEVTYQLPQSSDFVFKLTPKVPRKFFIKQKGVGHIKEYFQIQVFDKETQQEIGHIDILSKKQNKHSIRYGFESKKDLTLPAIEVYNPWKKYYRGIGRALMILAMNVSKELGANEFIALRVTSDEAKRFYSGLGFKPIKDSQEEAWFLSLRKSIPHIEIGPRPRTKLHQSSS